MPFKFKLWDMFENPKIKSSLSESQLHLFQVSDEYEEKMLLDFLAKHFSPITKIYGHELTASMFEEKCLGMDLFQDHFFYVIANSEKIGKMTQQFIVENFSKCTSHKLLFIFKQDSEFLKSLKKLKEFELYQLEAPAFYEIERVLSYLLRKAGLYLDEATLSHVLDFLPAEMPRIWSFVQILKLNFPAETALRKLTRSEIDPFLVSEKLDQFYFATLLSKKNLFKFYQELADQDFDIELWRRTLPFFLSHLKKLLNPSYTKKKNKLSNYDKEILACTNLWDEESLLNEMKELSQLELMARLNPAELKTQLRKRYLQELI